MRREANFQTKLRHYIIARVTVSGVFEAKQTMTDSLPFSSLPAEQRAWLLAAKHQSVTYKPPDDTRSHKPCDYIHLVRVPAWVIIRYPGGFVGIDIDDFIEESASSKRRSLTWERARAIARFEEISK